MLVLDGDYKLINLTSTTRLLHNDGPTHNYNISNNPLNA